MSCPEKHKGEDYVRHLRATEIRGRLRRSRADGALPAQRAKRQHNRSDVEDEQWAVDAMENH